MPPFDDLADYVAIPRLGGLALSPDGTRLVTSIAELSRDRKKYVSALWEIDPAGERPARRLTRSAEGESRPAFLPDGDLLFVSKRPDDDPESKDDDVTSLWRLPAAGGEAYKVAAHPGGIAAVATAEAADTVVVSASVLPAATDTGSDRELRKARKDADVNGILHESAPIRYWDHDLGPGQLRLLVADGGDVRDITPQPERALDEQRFGLTPDGRSALTGWNVPGEPGALHRSQLVAVDTATGERRVVAADDQASFGDPAVSPDGRWVVCVREQDGGYDRANDQTLWLIDLQTGEGVDLLPDLDRWPHSPVWAPGSDAVYFLADEDGFGPVFRVPVDGTRDVQRVASGAYFEAVCPARDGSAVYALRSRIDEPPTPVRLDPSGTDQAGEPLSAPGSVDVPGRVERVEATADDGTRIAGWLVLPEASGPAPLLLWIHGGPLNSWNSWSWRWNPWLMAAKGYAVLLPDPALSTGYGLRMVERGWGQWGGAPYTDLMTITDAVEQRPDIDESRTAAMGGSYGGYMANWVAGHTDRFRCIVTHASLWAIDQFQGTTDVPAYWAREWGFHDVAPERYQQWSPHHFADRITTPMLVIHGDKDYRVPIGEGLRLWWDLQRRGVESKFLYYPDENHWVLKPGNATVWYETVFAFLDQHVNDRPWTRPALV